MVSPAVVFSCVKEKEAEGKSEREAILLVAKQYKLEVDAIRGVVEVEKLLLVKEWGER